MEKRLLSPFGSFGPFIFLSFIFFVFTFFSMFCCKKRGLFSNRELLQDAQGFQVMKFSKENQMRHSHIQYQPKNPSRFCIGRILHVASDIFRVSVNVPHCVVSTGKLEAFGILYNNADSLFWCFSIFDTALTPMSLLHYSLTHVHCWSCTINVTLIWPFYDLFCL